MALNQDPYPGLQTVMAAPAPQLGGAVSQALRYVWDRVRLLSQEVKGPTTGTLNPDQKPTGLTVKDEGYRFFSTDFNREYRWTGTAWEDAPTAPPRHHIAFFRAGQKPEPSVGWARCDGAAATTSTAAGQTQRIQTPVIPVLSGQDAWLRL